MNENKDKYPPIWSSAAIQYVESILSLNMRAYEWGAGYSTIWLSRRVQIIYSMEHNLYWFGKINEIIETENIQNIVMLYHGLTEVMYLKHIQFLFESDKKESGKFFDFVSINGRDRVRCASQGVNVLRKGGILMVDDSEREHYRAIFSLKEIKLDKVIIEKKPNRKIWRETSFFVKL